MRKIIFMMILFPFVSFCQSLNQNFIKKTIYKIETPISISNPSTNQANTSVTYLDGFGRPVQTILNGQSSSGKDVVFSFEYDALGRKKREYLPYSLTTSNLNYEPSSTNDVFNYSQYIGQTPFKEIQYEESSLNRVEKIADEGNDWDLPISSTDPDHTLRYSYVFNNSNEVKVYQAQATWNPLTNIYDNSFYKNGSTYYPMNVLKKTVVKSPNWIATDLDNNTTHFFKDIDGKILLKRNFNNNFPLDTYYVYDQFNNLVYVIPPLVTNLLAQINGLCYQYKYDYRNRLVEKKLPGKQWEFMVYDKLDRMIANGPTLAPFTDLQSLQKVGWVVTKYDVFNRVVYTGWQEEGSVFNTQTRKLRQVNYDALPFLNEKRISSGTIDNISVSYSNSIIFTTTPFKILTINYYDNYTFPNLSPIPLTVEGQNTLSGAQVKSLLTGSWARVLTTSSSLSGTNKTFFYDNKGRLIRDYEKNHLGGYTYKDVKLDFIGMRQYMVFYHKRLSSDVELKVTDNFTYSNEGRLITHAQTIGTAVQLISKNSYNELGQLISKRVGGTDLSGTNALQKVDYSYNIRGWLTDINDVTSLSQSGAPLDLFAFKINYNTVQNEPGYVGTPLYNGNISETYWRTSNDNQLRKYGYKYDSMNRFTEAIYQKPGNTIPVPGSYNEKVGSYDSNGNIQKLKRNGNITDGSLPALSIDDLTYTYASNSNQLLSVSDNPSNNFSGFKDGVNTGSDFNYDAFGNLILDNNKGITDIKYNYLNLPTKVSFGSFYVSFVYDAYGNKLQKIVRDATTLTTTDYLSGIQYKNAVFQFFPTVEGYVIKSGANYLYVYQHKDHLGNARVSYLKNETTGQLDIIEESNFYPFGLKHPGYNGNVLSVGNSDAQKYKFQEQERLDELGLNWDNFKFRNYDSSIGRFMSVDPLSEKYHWQSTYSFCSNQVIHSREIEGLEAENDFNDDDGRVLTYLSPDQMQSGGAEGGEIKEVIIGGAYNPYREGVDKDFDEWEGTYFDRDNKGSGAYGWNYGSADFGLTALFNWFSNRQSGYVIDDGDMTEDFIGGSVGKDGVLYGVTQNPWAPGAEVHSFNPRPFVKDAKAFSDQFSTHLEIAGVLKNERDRDIEQDSIINSIFTSYYVVDKENIHHLAKTSFQRDSLMENGGVRFYKYE